MVSSSPSKLACGPLRAGVERHFIRIQTTPLFEVKLARMVAAMILASVVGAAAYWQSLAVNDALEDLASGHAQVQRRAEDLFVRTRKAIQPPGDGIVFRGDGETGAPHAEACTRLITTILVMIVAATFAGVWFGLSIRRGFAKRIRSSAGGEVST